MPSSCGLQSFLQVQKLRDLPSTLPPTVRLVSLGYQGTARASAPQAGWGRDLLAFGAELPCWVSEPKAGVRGGERILWSPFKDNRAKWSGVGRRARPRGVIKFAAVSLGPITKQAGPGSVGELCCPSCVISQTGKFPNGNLGVI